MPLPSIKGILEAAKRKKILIVLAGAIFLPLAILFFEILYCFNRFACISNLAHSFPLLSNLFNIDESESYFRKGNLILSKNADIISISGEIVKVQGDKVSLLLQDGSEKSFTVAPESRFIFDKPPQGLDELEISSDGLIFDGNNLEDILTSGDYVSWAPYYNKKISSKFINERKVSLMVPIVILRESE